MLAVRDLRFAYDSRPVLQGVSFDAPPGEVTALFGPNGSGKSTLFRCCLGLLPSRARELAVNGRAILDMMPGERARQMAYVPQEHTPAFAFGVRDMVMLGRTPHLGLLGRPAPADWRAVDEAIDRLGLADLAGCPCDRLSGGQRQLVLIARAVAQQTPVLLLDEPASSLDFQNQVRIWQTLGDLARAGTAIVCCTHDPNHVAWFCDRAVVMQAGRVVASGPPSETLRPATLERLYPGVCQVVSVGSARFISPRGLSESGSTAWR